MELWLIEIKILWEKGGNFKWLEMRNSYSNTYGGKKSRWEQRIIKAGIGEVRHEDNEYENVTAHALVYKLVREVDYIREQDCGARWKKRNIFTTREKTRFFSPSILKFLSICIPLDRS